MYVKVKQYENIVGENIRNFRQGRDLTQEELALMSGLSQGYINQLESGKRRFTQKTLSAVAEALGLPLVAFFQDKDRENLKISESAPDSMKRPPQREVIKIFKSLPPHVADHYFTLMSIEKNLYGKKKPPRQE